MKIKNFMTYFKKGLEIFQNFREFFKYFKVKYFIVHLYWCHICLQTVSQKFLLRRLYDTEYSYVAYICIMALIIMIYTR